MGQYFSRTTVTAASGTKASSQPRKRYGGLRRNRCFTTTSEDSVEVIESFGKFKRIARPGFNCVLCCFGQGVAGRLSTALQHHEVQCECKTEDGVFVELVFSIQYRVADDRLYEAYYSMANPDSQVTSYVLDAVATAVSHMTVDEVFENKSEMVSRVRDGLDGVLHEHGYSIKDCLITVLTPTPTVKDAMNSVLASRRTREAAVEQGEADKVRKVKDAEGSAESKYLQGQGLARFLVALAAGGREALKVFVTGRLGQQDLAFPEPPPRNDFAALDAAGATPVAGMPRTEEKAEQPPEHQSMLHGVQSMQGQKRKWPAPGGTSQGGQRALPAVQPVRQAGGAKVALASGPVVVSGPPTPPRQVVA